MAEYESFARVYDRFMDNVPYDRWAGRIAGILRQHGIRSGLVLDLGCGTGQMTRRLRAAGYDMIGVDASGDMLQIALDRETDSADGRECGSPESASSPAPDRILYLQQDMRAFELYGTVRAVCCCCDCLNYMLSETDLLTVFRLVENYLDPGGVFIFDMNTEFYYSRVLSKNTFADVRDECSLIWENDYDSVSGENEYDLTMFIRTENGLYQRSQETHVEKAYSFETVRGLAEKAGLIFEAVYDGYSEKPYRRDSERMTAVFRETDRKRNLQAAEKTDGGDDADEVYKDARNRK